MFSSARTSSDHSNELGLLGYGARTVTLQFGSENKSGIETVGKKLHQQ